VALLPALKVLMDPDRLQYVTRQYPHLQRLRLPLAALFLLPSCGTSSSAGLAGVRDQARRTSRVADAL